MVGATSRRRSPEQWKLWLMVVVAALSAVSVMAMVGGPTKAESGFDILEAETMSLSPSGTGSAFNDSAASGGKGLVVGTNATATGYVAGTARGISVRARGDQCGVTPPRMVIKVDGVEVMSQLVGSGTWAVYSVDRPIPSGDHTVTITYTNDYQNTSCNRNLRVDKVSFAPRVVFAHFHLGQAQGDTVEAYKNEIRAAQAAGIDGFAVNTASWNHDDRYRIRTTAMYDAAEELGTGFKLFLSLDMCCNNMSTAHIRGLIGGFYSHPNQYKFNGKAFVSTYTGEQENFADELPASWKQDVLMPMAAAGKPVYFMPHFYARNGEDSIYTFPPRECQHANDACIEQQYDEFPYVNGLFFFHGFAENGAGVTSAVETNRNYWLESKERDKDFMASISPLYSAHIVREDTGNHNNRVLGDVDGGEGMQQFWQGVIQDKPPYVELVTWNDFAESTYFGPARSQCADGGDGCLPHGAYLELSKHYIQWYKTGREPTITRDKLFYFYRTHSKDVRLNLSDPGCARADYSYCDKRGLPVPTGTDPQGPSAPPAAPTFVEDKIYVTAMLKTPATVRVTTGGYVWTSATLPAGIHNVSVPFRQGTQKVELLRNGVKVAESAGAVPISNSITTYDFNYYSNFVTAP